MARHATIVDNILDVYGDRWDVREYREGPGFSLAIGWPEGKRGQGKGGPRVIVTPELLGYFAQHRWRGGVQKMADELPIGNNAIKRIRRVVGHNIYDDTTNWWIDRMEELLTMTGAEFAEKYGKSEAACSLARSLIFGERRCRARRWWLTEPTKSILLSDYPVAIQADLLDLPAGSVRRLRAMVQRAMGVSDEQIADRGRKRMLLNKVGVPTRNHDELTAQARQQRKRKRKKRKKPYATREDRRKLTTEQVVEIRLSYAAGQNSLSDLGEQYGVSGKAVSLIVLGKTYRDAGGPIIETRRKRK